ncbi:hypothetical protein Q1695_015535 [Nippostrongylus brasiliensis]|nr:hypothetical protein Q1695_015535 [Nippostrongylus brasiliensis]
MRDVLFYLLHCSSKEFVQAAAASSINRFSYDGFEEIIDVKMFQTLFTIATQLTEDIKLAKSKVQERRGTNLSQMFPTRDSNGREFSTINCVDQWFLLPPTAFHNGSRTSDRRRMGN